MTQRKLDGFKADAANKQLVDRMLNMNEELERLRKVKDISESIVRLPQVCVEDLRTAKDVRKAKESALSDALEKVKAEDYENLVSDIENIQEKSKKAYVRLYERVGEDIGLNFLEKLDYMDFKGRQGSSEADKLIESSQGKYSSAHVELKRLQDEKKRIQQM